MVIELKHTRLNILRREKRKRREEKQEEMTRALLTSKYPNKAYVVKQEECFLRKPGKTLHLFYNKIIHGSYF